VRVAHPGLGEKNDGQGGISSGSPGLKSIGFRTSSEPSAGAWIPRVTRPQGRICSAWSVNPRWEPTDDPASPPPGGGRGVGVLLLQGEERLKGKEGGAGEGDQRSGVYNDRLSHAA